MGGIDGFELPLPEGRAHGWAMRTTTVLFALALAGCGSDYTQGVSVAEVDETTPAAEAPTAPAEEAAELEHLSLDPATSTLGYTGAKLTGSHDGSFPDFTGSIELDAAGLERSHVSIDIDTRTLVADRDRLTQHLRSPDFFDVERFPSARFRSTAIEAGGEGDATHTITGTLELHGQTHQLRFPATIDVSEGEVRARAEFVIDRTTWGISYPGRAEDLIRNEVVIRFDVRAPRSAAGA
jgi:polyisoprenoid-binding protein YceI